MEGNRPYYSDGLTQSRFHSSTGLGGGRGYPYGPEYEEALIDVSQRHNIMLLCVVEDAILAAE
jgi:hypothetical protein